MDSRTRSPNRKAPMKLYDVILADHPWYLTSEQVAVEKWLDEHDAKLHQYASALEARDSGDLFEVGDFYEVMRSRIWMQGTMTRGFIEMPAPYLFKVVWNEGLMMLRKQRCYNMHIQSVIESEDGDDFIDSLPGPDFGNPENAKISRDDQDLISKAIASLPEKSRRVCEMLYAGERPADIARKLGLKSRATINYHIEKIQETFLRFGLQPV